MSLTPHIDAPASVRRFLAVMAAGSVIVLVYASLVPLHYTPLSWSETLARWRTIPWLNIDLYGRADWVANALVVVPAGFLAAAAVGWGLPTRWRLLFAAPLISLFLAAVVLGIELVQVWFPPRTVSLNDIVAGFVGAAVGPLVWVLAGRRIEYGITQFLTLPRFQDRLIWLCLGYLAFVMIYGVMPLDLVITPTEWRERVAEDAIRLDPFHGPDAALHALKGTVLGALRMGPVGLLLALARRRRMVMLWLLLLPALLELLQLPVFSKYVSTMEIVGGWLGGALGYFAGRNFHRFERLSQRPSLWGMGWFATLLVTVTALLLRYHEVLHDWTQIAQRFSEAWALPLVKYYSGSEYNALTNVLLKLAPFAVMGATAFGWERTSSPRTQQRVFWLTLVVVLVAAPAIELVQVFLPPQMPDASDVFTYWVGYIAGYKVMHILWGGVATLPSGRLGQRAQPYR